jgi:hypothetical protein
MKVTAGYSTWMAGWEKEYTLIRQLYRNVLRHSGKTVLIDPFHEKSFAFKKLDEEPSRFADAFLTLGLDDF